MNRPAEKPYMIFLCSIPLMLLIGLWNDDAVLDLNLYDTYYVIPYLDLTIFASILFGIIGMGYWIMEKAGKNQLKWLIWTHIGLTFGGILLIWILSKFYRTEILEYKFNDSLTLIISLIVLLILLAQFVFPINIIYGLMKSKN